MCSGLTSFPAADTGEHCHCVSLLSFSWDSSWQLPSCCSSAWGLPLHLCIPSNRVVVSLTAIIANETLESKVTVHQHVSPNEDAVHELGLREERYKDMKWPRDLFSASRYITWPRKMQGSTAVPGGMYCVKCYAVSQQKSY